MGQTNTTLTTLTASDLKAVAAVANGHISQVRTPSPFFYVESATRPGRVHSVFLSDDGDLDSCTCEATVPCWHLRAAELYVMARLEGVV